MLHSPSSKVWQRVWMFPPGQLLRDPCPGFYWDLVTWAVSAWHFPEFQAPRGGTGVLQRPHRLYKQLRLSEPLLSVVGMVGAPHKSEVPCTSQGPTFRRRAVRPTVLTVLHGGLLASAGWRPLILCRARGSPHGREFLAQRHQRCGWGARTEQGER